MALTPKQARFVREYLVDLNATQAAIRSGYSPKTAASQAHDLLKTPEISEAVSVGQERVLERAVVTAEEVLSGLKKEAESAESDSARVAAWGLLGKHLALFVDRTELTGKDGEGLTIKVVSYEGDD